jgi:hypothetical protein
MSQNISPDRKQLNDRKAVKIKLGTAGARFILQIFAAHSNKYHPALNHPQIASLFSTLS